MANRGEAVLLLGMLAAAGAGAILLNWPRKEKTSRFSVGALKAAFDQLQSVPPADGPELEISAPDCNVRFTFFVVDGSIEMRLDSLDENPSGHLARFESTAERLGLAPERPGVDDFGHEGESAVTLVNDPEVSAKYAASIIEDVCGVTDGSAVEVESTSFDVKWAASV